LFQTVLVTNVMPAVRTNNDSEVVPSCNSEKPYRRRSTRRKYSGPYLLPSQSSDSDEMVATTGDAHRRREKSLESEFSVIEISSTSEEEEPVGLAPEPPSDAKFKGITICGVQLRPTVAFDTFWRFAAERKSIDDKRRAGEPSP